MALMKNKNINIPIDDSFILHLFVLLLFLLVISLLLLEFVLISEIGIKYSNFCLQKGQLLLLFFILLKKL